MCVYRLYINIYLYLYIINGEQLHRICHFKLYISYTHTVCVILYIKNKSKWYWSWQRLAFPSSIDGFTSFSAFKPWIYVHIPAWNQIQSHLLFIFYIRFDETYPLIHLRVRCSFLMLISAIFAKFLRRYSRRNINVSIVEKIRCRMRRTHNFPVCKISEKNLTNDTSPLS